jgi:hypothetical protein
MKRFEFLIGNWNLEYRIPKSLLSEAGSDSGRGSMRRALNDKYVIFDYSTQSGGEAHGVFTRDERTNVYRFWWFENSGSFMAATCNFLDDGSLAMNWHDSLLVQTFEKESTDKVILKMQSPVAPGRYELVLEVILMRE